jgi:hypothetical protein
LLAIYQLIAAIGVCSFAWPSRLSPYRTPSKSLPLISGEWLLLHFSKAFFSLKTPLRVPALTGEFSFSLD